MRLNTLDLFRFLAAFLVVLYHYISNADTNAFPTLSIFTQYGYLGVPFFFIISGFVITFSSENRTPTQFAIARFVRLYPALWIGCLFTVFWLSLLEGKTYSLERILLNFTLINEYFGEKDIDVVYWTLKAELKFYACIFLLIAFRWIKYYKIWLSSWLLLTVSYITFGQPFFLGWFISPSYSPYFIIGVSLFLIYRNNKSIFAKTILILASLIAGYQSYKLSSGFIPDIRNHERIVASLLTLLFIVIFYLVSLEKIKIRDNKTLLKMGALTYPLYLIHNLAGKAIIKYLTVHIGEELATLSTILFMLFVSWLIFNYFERIISTPLKNFLFNIHAKLRVR